MVKGVKPPHYDRICNVTSFIQLIFSTRNVFVRHCFNTIDRMHSTDCSCYTIELLCSLETLKIVVSETEGELIVFIFMIPSS
jgi:hypothetical protein